MLIKYKQTPLVYDEERLIRAILQLILTLIYTVYS